MRCVSLHRFILWLLACCVLVVSVWIALPSPDFQTTGLSPGAYQTRELQAGRVLTTIHRNPSWEQGYDLDTQYDAFALEWQLSQTTNSNGVTGLVLTINDNVHLPLDDLASRPSPHVSPEVYIVQAKNGNPDGVVLPWFTYADQILLSWVTDRYLHMQNVTLRVVVSEPGTVQIWPDHPSMSDELTDLAMPAFATFTHVSSVQHESALSSFAMLSSSQDMPSSTLFVRMFIGANLKALVLTAYDTIEQAWYWTADVLEVLAGAIWGLIRFAAAMSVCYLGAVALVWVASGCPSFPDWHRHFALTRALYERMEKPRTKVWTLAGTVDAAERDSFDEEAADVSLGPRPLSGPAAFFRSRAPLDDLLVTFQVTAWMVRPIRLRHRTNNIPSTPVSSDHLLPETDGVKIIVQG